jgi:Chitobiase/beta-hexosaminidase C-terminal domain
MAPLFAFAGIAACTGSGPSGGSTSIEDGDGRCWALPIVNRVRVFPAPGRAAELVNGKIMGSTTSRTTDFVDLVTIASTPAEGTFTEANLTNATPYRYVKYYGPLGSYGAIAELEFYAGTQRLQGAGFGVAGSRDGGGNTYDRAIDGDTSSFFEGPLPDGDYVGLDLGADHETASPVFDPPAGQYDTPPAVAISTATADPSIRYTTDGTDPTGAGQTYGGPVQVETGATTIKAVASESCMLDSQVAQASYRVGHVDSAKNQASIHIGNSLTDTLVGRLDVVARSAGITLDFHRYTIPGAGTQWLWNNPTAGFGETDIKASLQTIRFDQMSLQPFPNEPCTPTGNESDTDYVNRFYGLAQEVNPSVLLWIYQQWPEPHVWNDCFSIGAAWATPPWIPPIPNPATWEDAVSNQLAYQEAVRKGVMDANPGKPVYIVPGGLALRDLKKEIEAGRVTGWTDFATSIFDQGGTDVHLTAAGRWFITLVFDACMFQKSSLGVGYEDTGLSTEQAAKLAQVAWDTVNAYPLSGVSR